MKYLTKIDEDAVLKFSDFEKTQYNSIILIENIMSWLRLHYKNDTTQKMIIYDLKNFLKETNIDINQLKTFMEDQNVTNSLKSYKITIEDDKIKFHDFNTDLSENNEE